MPNKEPPVGEFNLSRLERVIYGPGKMVVIEDTGPGIPHEIRDKVFEPFVTAGKENGLGLGLAFSRQAVLDHGGDMWIEPAAGARFVIRLPLNGGEGF